MKMKTIAAVVLAMTCMGCSYTGLLSKPVPPPDDKHEVDARYAYLSCNLETVRKYTTDTQIRDSDGVYLYALMASNAYEDEGQYEIPGWTRVRRFESTSGLGLDEYERIGSDPLELVVAYRGTSNFTDWGANLALIEPAQHREAYDRMVELRAIHPEAKITATGHSLGGALALNMSTRFDNLPAYVFNSSPRAFFAAKGKSNSRTLVWETGELLNVVRRPWLAARMQDAPRMPFNFMDYNWHNSLKAIREHNMYGLSRGLLIAAVANGNPHAKQVFTANVSGHASLVDEVRGCDPMFDVPMAQ